jgi:hypothetical protein
VAHSKQVVASAMSLNVPAAQPGHMAAPGADEKVPREQAVQDAMSPALNFPAAQAEQNDELAGEKLPAPHAEQVVAFAVALNLPAAQPEHMVAPTEDEKVPAAQSSQNDMPGPSPNWPALQTEHIVPTVALYFPASQALQAPELSYPWPGWQLGAVEAVVGLLVDTTGGQAVPEELVASTMLPPIEKRPPSIELPRDSVRARACVCVCV